jgi:hypothetical protein
MALARCPSCRATSEVPDAMTGRRIPCPACGAKFTVSLPEFAAGPTAARGSAPPPAPTLRRSYRRVNLLGVAVIVGVCLLAVLLLRWSRNTAYDYQPPPPPPEYSVLDLYQSFRDRPRDVQHLLGKPITVSGAVVFVALPEPKQPSLVIALRLPEEEAGPKRAFLVFFYRPQQGGYSEDVLRRVGSVRMGDFVRATGMLTTFRAHDGQETLAVVGASLN